MLTVADKIILGYQPDPDADVSLPHSLELAAPLLALGSGAGEAAGAAEAAGEALAGAAGGIDEAEGVGAGAGVAVSAGAPEVFADAGVFSAAGAGLGLAAGAEAGAGALFVLAAEAAPELGSVGVEGADGELDGTLEVNGELDELDHEEAGCAAFS
jgi:hypothetical protein